MIAGPAAFAITIVNLVVLRRLGLVSSVVSLTAFILFQRFPMTFDSSAWYFGIGLTGLFVFAAFALYGFRTSLGGRPLFGASSLED